MVIAQELVKKIDGLVAHEALVVGIDKRVPGLAREPGEDLVILGIKLDFVLVEILKELFSPKYLGNLDQLV